MDSMHPSIVGRAIGPHFVCPRVRWAWLVAGTLAAAVLALSDWAGAVSSGSASSARPSEAGAAATETQPNAVAVSPPGLHT